MKYIFLAATAGLILAVAPAFAPAYAQVGAVSVPPKADDVASGGHADNNIAAATGAVQGSVTGEGNMNGPNMNGQPDSAYPTNQQAANMRGVGSHLDPDAPVPYSIGQAAGQ